MYKNAVKAAFESVDNLDVAICRIELFQSLARNEEIEFCLEQQASQVRMIFIRLCQQIKGEFDEYAGQISKVTTVAEPRYAGAAKWCTSMISYVEHHWEKMIASSYSLVKTGDEAEQAKYSIVSSLAGYQQQCFEAWTEGLEQSGVKSDAEEKLSNSLLTRKGGGVVCTFSLDLIETFAEASAWERLGGEGFEMPAAITSLGMEWETFRCSREQVLLAVRAYNNVLQLLDEDDFLLFKDHIHHMDKQIQPGLSKRLNWKTPPKVIVRFVQVRHYPVFAYHRMPSTVYSDF
jgi:hypothetical protein